MSKTKQAQTPRTKARLVNVSLANHSFQVLRDSGGDDGKKFYRKVRIKPLGATEEEFDLTDPMIAGMLKRPAVGREEVRENPALRQRTFLAPYAEPGTEIEEFTGMGNKYKTCKYIGTVADGTRQIHPRPIHLSVFQAQRLLVQLSDIPRIEFYLSVDERPLVQQYGRDLLHYRRTNLERAVQGLDPVRGNQAVTQSVSSGFSVDLG